MRKGIFERLLLTYILILAVIIGVMSLSLSQFLRSYFFEEKQKELLSMGRQIETYLIMFHRGDISKEELTRQINTVGHAVNARVIVVQGDKARLNEQGIDSDFEDLFKQVVEGNVVVKTKQYASELDDYVVAVGVPISTANQTRGAIMLFSPVYEVSRTLDHVYRVILAVAGFSLVIGLLLVWTYSRKISGPIIKLSQLASCLAEGKQVADLKDETGGEIGQLINAFNSMKNQLARVDKMRQEFIAAVSHELRTPLTSVRGFIQGILDGMVPPEEQNKYLKLAFKETGRLNRLTNDLLELTKLEAGAIQLNKSEMAVKDILEDSIMSAREGEAGKNLPVSIEVNPPELKLIGDPDRVRQIFINLINNSFKFTPEDGSVLIKAYNRTDKIVFEISDTGIGIPEGELPFIFEKFHQVDKARSTSSGTGLGLNIVRNLVELHGGTIAVTSVPGKGTVFTMTFPAF